MNRLIAPEIKNITKIHTGFTPADKNIYRIPAEEGVFKLELIYEGAGYGSSGKKFQALYAMDLLLSGTKEEDANAIAEKLDALGAYVFKNCDYYNSSVTIYGQNEHFRKTLEIVKKSMDNSVYPLDELETFKNRKLSELNINLNKTNFLANRSINHLVLGKNHPFAKISDESTIRSIAQEELIEFRSNYLQSPSYFIFTGPSDIRLEEELQNLSYHIGQFSFSKTPEVLPESDTPFTEFITKSSTQNSLRMGKILPSRTEPEYFNLVMFNLILGGYFGSRLMKNIREEKGLTYGIHSSITPFKNFSYFKIGSECNSSLTETVKTEIEKEIVQLQTELVSEEELNVAKNYLLGSMLRNFDGSFNVSERYKGFLELNSPADFYDRYFEAINKIVPEDIRACANNYFDLNTLKYSVAGEI